MGKRTWLAVILLAVATPALAAESPSDGATLVFDLDSPDAVVLEHTAQMLWNLTTDNIVPERLDHVTGWNSLYLEKPGAVSGQVVADLAAGTVTGEIIEKWACNNDCVTIDGTPSWTTTRDTGWTATITNGTVTPGNAGWVISGNVAIRYKAEVTSNESPSECAGEPCYICQNRVCEVGGDATATVSLEGWFDGETLSLNFFDQLEADAHEMDLSSLTRTEFFMSRFLLTIRNAIVPAVAEPPPEEPAPESPDLGETTTNDSATDQDLSGGQVIPGVGAGSPPSESGGDAPPQQTTPAQSTKEPRVGIAELIAIVTLIMAGTAGVLIIGFLIRRLLGWDAYEAAVDAVRAEGLQVAPDAGASHWNVLDEASRELSAAQSPSNQPPLAAATPSEYYASKSGLKSGRYRQVVFATPVYLEQQHSATTIELLTTRFTGTALIGEPDPATPHRTPVFTNDGKELGFVKTSDVPRPPWWRRLLGRS